MLSWIKVCLCLSMLNSCAKVKLVSSSLHHLLLLWLWLSVSWSEVCLLCLSMLNFCAKVNLVMFLIPFSSFAVTVTLPVSCFLPGHPISPKASYLQVLSYDWKGNICLFISWVKDKWAKKSVWILTMINLINLKASFYEALVSRSYRAEV